MKVKEKRDRMATRRKDKDPVIGTSDGRNSASSNVANWAEHRPKRNAHTATITSKGQITMPKLIRNHLQVGKGDRIEFLIGPDGKVTLMPATTDVKKLKGIVGNPHKPVSVGDMNRVIEEEGGRK